MRYPHKFLLTTWSCDKFLSQSVCFVILMRHALQIDPAANISRLSPATNFCYKSLLMTFQLYLVDNIRTRKFLYNSQSAHYTRSISRENQPLKSRFLSTVHSLSQRHLLKTTSSCLYLNIVSGDKFLSQTFFLVILMMLAWHAAYISRLSPATNFYYKRLLWHLVDNIRTK